MQVLTVGLVTCSGSVNAVSVAATDVQIKNDIIDSKGQTGISSAILASTSSGVQWGLPLVRFLVPMLQSIVTATHKEMAMEQQYTNTSDSILFVSATIRVDTWGYYIVAEVDGTEVALDRDNGSAQAGNVWINVQFFVPRGSTYKIESYNQNDVEVTDSTTKIGQNIHSVDRVFLNTRKGI